eukprot:CAMPEP_0197714420 /NCGR_PEP_ID=MMETSP1338-20131121/130952_1 /TAXON_ID=43686 ORGANISM="Pelagodinium beii, Strain RCC1491" /NCGR_SAMPLE_ID=MMETSP1338 /ASSEMBLY_ACC=CAM_ASM_000754 /LENGTH=43 /DNA_ID= /DNA_START= /DNA_END= /DNA_ORIENTATION=
MPSFAAASTASTSLGKGMEPICLILHQGRQLQLGWKDMPIMPQ